MMKTLTLFCVATALFLFSSCSDKRPELKDIRSQKTASHLNIGSTRLFMIPPKGFSIADDFVGLIRDRNCTIRFVESKGEKIRGNFLNYSDDAFIKQGNEILESRKIHVNEFPGKLIVITGESKNSEKLYLLFGDNSFSALVTAEYQTVEKKTREEIYHALESIYFDRNFQSQLSMNASYLFTDTNSRYKFCEKMEQFDVYTIDGELKAINSQDPLIMVTTMEHMRTAPLDKVSEMNRLGMKKLGVTDLKVSELSHEPINGYETLSLKISFTAGGVSKTSYQAFFKKGDQIVLVQGIVFDKDLDKLEEIKQFIYSIAIP